jgi:DNA-binding MarR family transcriptional regulator
MPGYLALACIEELGQASQQEVARCIRFNRSDLVRVLDELEDDGLILRERNPDDRRAHIVTVTKKGQRLLVRATDMTNRITDASLQRLSPGEAQTLHRLALTALGEDPGHAGDRSDP